jgi:hypothetical protein
MDKSAHQNIGDARSCLACGNYLYAVYEVCPHCLRACAPEIAVDCEQCGELISLRALNCWFCEATRDPTEPPQSESGESGGPTPSGAPVPRPRKPPEKKASVSLKEPITEEEPQKK